MSNDRHHDGSTNVRVVHYSHQLGLGGTEKCMQYMLEYLRDAGHECYCLHHRDKTRAAGGHREGLIARLLGRERVFGYGSEAEFFEIIGRLRPEIFHIHRSGRPDEFPVVPELRKYVHRCVETNVFGGHDPTPVIDLTLYPSDYLYRNARKPPRRAAVLANPVKPPAAPDGLRSALGVPPGTFVMGRIGRPDDYLFDPISLRALAELERDAGRDVLYLVQSPPPKMMEMARDMGLERIRFLTTPVLDDDEVSRFFNTIDVFAHARRDGETFGLSIAEAMIHGKPVVSHRSRVANGHVELVKACGFLAGVDDHRAYARYLRRLRDDERRCKELGEAARQFASRRFLLPLIGAALEAHYERLLRDA
jgi:glycosyltransferase involved in cell wall biosynthesis